MSSGPVVLPYVPETITVHLGLPDQSAANYTVSYSEYLKNVASSEIYPTWGVSALRANILAINSFALNRIYTEYYRSRGYDFDITNTTSVDQAFVPNRNFFENISQLVDSLFNQYIRRIGYAEPLSAKFCDGRMSTCQGMSQWGSEDLSRQGYDSLQILQHYYGPNIEIVTNAPIRGITESYPGILLRLGSTGPYVAVVQTALNEIGKNYPLIPKIDPVDGIYGVGTEAAVKQFQKIFSLSPDGIVGKATWYQINRVYVAVLQLTELQSQGQSIFYIGTYPQGLSLEDEGNSIRQLQYMLRVLSAFIPEIPAPFQTGVFNSATQESVRAFQRFVSLPITGIVDAQTWDAIYSFFSAVETNVFHQQPIPSGNSGTYARQITIQYPGRSLSIGDTDGGDVP